MWRFIIEILVTLIVVVLLGCVFCIPGYSQNWQDEQHVWNEEKGEWEVKNKARGRADVEEAQPPTQKRPYVGEPWAKYLSRNVRYGKREPSEWEINEAQRKHWANQALKERGRQKAEQRRQTIAYRKATGWYDKRRQASYNNYANVGYRMANTYYHMGCVARRSDMYKGPNGPGNNYGYRPPSPQYQGRNSQFYYGGNRADN